jgi:glycine dehydrogenase
MLRYLRRLADKDIALDRSMIPLGSCTMKLNATSEMIPVAWPEFAHMHPFAPSEQWRGYRELIDELERMLAQATGYASVSLQPNAGSQGEYAGLLIIKAWHESRGEGHRNVCLIPSSAHGTNPASAQMAGMQVVVVSCDVQGNVELADLEAKAAQHADRLAAIMVTYPSTHGVFEAGITHVCEVVHRHGGQVYVDGANMNAMVGLCAPGEFGGDVSHLNLHKTFCIPHGGGGPGRGPVAVSAPPGPFLPGIAVWTSRRAPSAPSRPAPFGSASILPISWMYIVMMGASGLTAATESRSSTPITWRGGWRRISRSSTRASRGLVAHECILDLRGSRIPPASQRGRGEAPHRFRLPRAHHVIPGAGTLMVEPTESESKAELDRFCDAMIAIRDEIRAVEDGRLDREDNPLRNAPHTAAAVTAETWEHRYSRETAAYPVQSLRHVKYWSPVGRADNVFGDRNLICSCPPTSMYE